MVAKDGELVNLSVDYPIFARAQNRYYDRCLDDVTRFGTVRKNVLKARQMGFSLITGALMLWLMGYLPNRRGIIVAHDDDGSRGLLQRLRDIYDNLPDWLMPEKRYDNRGHLRPKTLFTGDPTQGFILVETAKNVRAGRGETYHLQHHSEVAFWGKDAHKVHLGLRQALPDVPGTMLVRESTANGIGGFFYDEVVKSLKGESESDLHFAPWFESDEYRMPLDHMYADKYRQNQARQVITPDEFISSVGRRDKDVLTDHEVGLIDDHGLDAEQILWRRYALVSKCRGDEDHFRQEYPATWEEAFIVSGSPVFATTRLARMLRKCVEPRRGTIVLPALGEGQSSSFLESGGGEVMVWDDPVVGHEYVVGVDLAEGSEDKYTIRMDDYNLDRSAAVVLDRNDAKVVAGIHGRMTPTEMRDILFPVLQYYNTPWVAPENNAGYGTVLNRGLREMKYVRLYTQRIYDNTLKDWTYRMGWNTNRATRPLLFESGRRAIREGAVTIPWRELLEEMLGMVYRPLPSGAAKPEAKPGAHDDIAIAFLIAWQVHCELSQRSLREHIEDGAYQGILAGEWKRVMSGFYDTDNKKAYDSLRDFI